MHRRDKIHSMILWCCSILAFGACICLIVFFVWTLAIRTEYRSVCLDINNAVLASSGAENTIQCGDEIYPASETLVEYYNMYLLAPGTTVFNRRLHDVTQETLTLSLPDGILLLTGLEDGTAVAVEWRTDETTRHYTVRNSSLTYTQLMSYFVNYRNRLDLQSAA